MPSWLQRHLPPMRVVLCLLESAAWIIMGFMLADVALVPVSAADVAPVDTLQTAADGRQLQTAPSPPCTDSWSGDMRYLSGSAASYFTLTNGDSYSTINYNTCQQLVQSMLSQGGTYADCLQVTMISQVFETLSEACCASCTDPSAPTTPTCSSPAGQTYAYPCCEDPSTSYGGVCVNARWIGEPWFSEAVCSCILVQGTQVPVGVATVDFCCDSVPGDVIWSE